MADDKQDDGKIYLIVPSASPPVEGGEQPETMGEAGHELQGGPRDMIRAVFGERKEVSIDAEKVKEQIGRYVRIVQGVAGDVAQTASELELEEVTLSLTLSAAGNIGIASTSAEAGIALKFMRGGDHS